MSVPKYIRVYNALKKEIESEEFKPGDFLPPEHTLEKIYNVSRSTIRGAVKKLADLGYVSLHQGKGTIVMDYRITQKLNYVTSFSETLRERGYKVDYRSLEMTTRPAPKPVASRLGIKSDAEVVFIRRIVSADEKPMAIMVNYLLPGLVQGIRKHLGGAESLYVLLENQYGIRIDSSIDSISAAGATEEEAALLAVPEGTPLLVNNRITFSEGTPFEFVDLRVLGDRYEFSIHMQGRPDR